LHPLPLPLLQKFPCRKSRVALPAAAAANQNTKRILFTKSCKSKPEQSTKTGQFRVYRFARNKNAVKCVLRVLAPAATRAPVNRAL
jgi:hypothetical protein